MSSINILVVSGLGINCEQEMAMAFQLAGGVAHLVHVNELLKNDFSLEKYHLIAFPGGFSFGDELGAGKVFANRLLYTSHLSFKLKEFVNDKKCILGICNGFQVLLKLGLFFQEKEPSEFSLTYNEKKIFINRWVTHRVISKKCIFLKGISSIELPIRHGEGKFVASTLQALQKLKKKDQVALQYDPINPNGSVDNIAGICDETGRVFAMMAHPEAALFFTNHPHWTKRKEQYLRANKKLPQYGEGLKIFQNAISYLKEVFYGQTIDQHGLSQCH
ncbi:MAG: phosphoribosylformylglycinamidine synthase subunit PurQ [Chlamydiota bacterium]|jgi:phosphoribosylformylglycinamidine synthase